MSASTSPGVPMTRDEVDRALAALGPAYDRIAAAMFALDNHPGLGYLRNAGLTGTSRSVAENVQALMVMLWAQFTVLRQQLELARGTRAARSRPGDEELARLTGLLRAPVVALTADGMPLDRADVVPARRLTLAELARGLDTSTAELADVLAEVDVAVSAVAGRLAALTDVLGEVRAMAAALGEEDGVADLDRALHRARGYGLADPVEVARGGARGAAVDDRLDRLAADLDAARDRLVGLARLRDEYPHRLARLRDAVDGVADEEARAAQAYAVVHVKIANPGLPEIPAAAAGLRDRLSDLDPLPAAGGWAGLADEVTGLERAATEAQAHVRRLRAAADGLLDRRTELRGRLDAYRAKAARLGYGEHPGLSARHRQAQDLLYTSPCDLAAATRAVFAYQQALAELADPTSYRPRETSV